MLFFVACGRIKGKCRFENCDEELAQNLKPKRQLHNNKKQWWKDHVRSQGRAVERQVSLARR